MKTPRKAPLSIQHEFVEFIPEELAPRTLYVSVDYATAAHACFCGCGEKVVTPISPIGWQLLFDGDTVSLHPSVGNWSFRCQSHYWVKRDQVHWAETMSPAQIAQGRRQDRAMSASYYGADPQQRQEPTVGSPSAPVRKKSLLDWLLGRD